MEILTPTPARKVPKSGQHSETKATSLFLLWMLSVSHLRFPNGSGDFREKF